MLCRAPGSLLMALALCMIVRRCERQKVLQQVSDMQVDSAAPKDDSETGRSRTSRGLAPSPTGLSSLLSV